MANRKPLDEKCNGSIDCPVEGHTTAKSLGKGRWNFSHIQLTRGQQLTLWERQSQARVTKGS